ncbi:MAG TPA: hypothetical protein VEM40_01070 [Nitrospirota bacterium]|nr:hypothetical protein [Nitrospirota bacterium]
MTSLRPMTSKERQALIAKAKNPVTLTRALLIAAFLSTICIGIILVVSRFLGFLRPNFPVLFSSIITACLVYSIHSYNKLRFRISLTLYEKDLADGVAEVTRFRVTRAIRVKEFEGEDGGYYLHLEDGRTLFLRGGYLCDLEEAEKFPCSEFDIVRGPKSGLILDLVCSGPYLPSQRTIVLFGQPELKELLTDGDIVAIPWEKIDRLPASAKMCPPKT